MGAMRNFIQLLGDKTVGGGQVVAWVRRRNIISIIVYGGFDKIIHTMDKNAYKVKNISKLVLTFVSLYGLGFPVTINLLHVSSRVHQI
jgi:hypothetical protein